MTLLDVQNLTLRFGQTAAIDDVSFTIGKGEMLALVGESGSGKSLTALSCLGLQPDSATIGGSIRFDGQEIIGAPEAAIRPLRGKRISMIFQEPMTALNPLHTIGKQIGEILTIHRQPAGADAITSLLEQVGLAHLASRLDAYPHQLSGGERQRVMIAMAIANRPELLIADEPTTAVDVTVQVKILKLLKELQASLGMSILFITHDLTVVRRLCDRVAVMQQGKLVEIGPVADIFASPKHPYTQHLLASEPKGSPPAPPANPKPVMSCEHLKVFFPIKKGLFRRTVDVVKAVNDLSITIPESTTLGVVGESGSGKSTLGFALLRLIKSDGKIVFLQKDISNLRNRALRPWRSKMQMVFQDPYASLNPRMTVRQIIEEGLRIHFPDLSEAQRTRDIDHILEEVGLSPEHKTRYPHEFSGGQRQRISIARAMILKPKFVVLDEPTSALDLTIQSQIIELLKDLQQKYGLSYLFISHDLRVVKAISHQIIVMKNGQIVEQADTETLFANPQNDYTKALIAAAFLK